MSENELRPCPFCGGTKICTEKGINLNYCDNCSAESNIEHWNTRPIEDELQKRIAELEMKIRHNALWQASEDAEERAHLEKLVPDLKKRIAELEGLVERLIEIGDWATIGMVISESYSPSSNMRKLAEDRRNEWEALVKDWKEREE